MSGLFIGVCYCDSLLRFSRDAWTRAISDVVADVGRVEERPLDPVGESLLDNLPGVDRFPPLPVPFQALLPLPDVETLQSQGLRLRLPVSGWGEVLVPPQGV